MFLFTWDLKKKAIQNWGKLFCIIARYRYKKRFSLHSFSPNFSGALFLKERKGSLLSGDDGHDDQSVIKDGCHGKDNTAFVKPLTPPMRATTKKIYLLLPVLLFHALQSKMPTVFVGLSDTIFREQYILRSVSWLVTRAKLYQR